MPGRTERAMIISHQHRYIFFAIPKTGTHSVRQALRAHMGPQDLEQVGLFEQKRFPFPEFADIRHGHISTRQIRPVLGDEIFAAYTKFAFVRNPFDRFVSYCAFMSRGKPTFETAAAALHEMDHPRAQAVRPPAVPAAARDGHRRRTAASNSTWSAATRPCRPRYDAICARIGLADARDAGARQRLETPALAGVL